MVRNSQLGLVYNKGVCFPVQNLHLSSLGHITSQLLGFTLCDEFFILHSSVTANTRLVSALRRSWNSPVMFLAAFLRIVYVH